MSRGWEKLTSTDVARLGRQQRQPAAPARSKYRNVKTVIDGQTFDSRREADYYRLLKAREQLGEIKNLARQVEYELYAPVTFRDGPEEWVTVAVYIADFVYTTPDGVIHVVDAKGHRTREYQLKKKWLELQSNIHIQEV